MAHEEDEEAQCEKLEKSFEAEREKWGGMINPLISKTDSVGALSEAQVLMLSYRHMLTDLIAKYKNAYNARLSKDSVFKRIRTAHYKTGVDIRYTDRDIADHVAADMALRTRKNGLLKTQYEFLSDMVDTLDKLGYAIRNKIELATRLS